MNTAEDRMTEALLFICLGLSTALLALLWWFFA